MQYRFRAPAAPFALVALDPGKYKIGVCVFRVAPEGVKLRFAATIDTPFQVQFDPRLSADRQEMAIRGAVYCTIGDVPLALVCEVPRKYDFAPAYHADIDALLSVLRILRKRLGGAKGAYPPNRWKGNVPKEVHHKRVISAAAANFPEWSPETLETLGHDGLDALGIGLFALGILNRGGTAPAKVT
jgi:hypothetical protein